MHHRDEEIHDMLREIIEKLCTETFLETSGLASTENKGCNGLPGNINLQTSQGDQEDNRKSEFHFFDSQSDADVELYIKTSTPANQRIANQDFGVVEQESLDKTIEEAMGKYEFSFEENKRKCRDVYVQTVCSGTTDKQCQCDLDPQDSHSVSDRSSTTKKIKLDCGFSYSKNKNTHWKTETYELQQTEEKKQYFESDRPPPSQIKAPRIRVGLSKRVRPAPLHILN